MGLGLPINAAGRDDLRIDDVDTIDSPVTETEVNDHDLVPELFLNTMLSETHAGRVVGQVVYSGGGGVGWGGRRHTCNRDDNELVGPGELSTRRDHTPERR